MLLSVGFFDERRGIAVGGTSEFGPSTVLVTPDDGRTWDAYGAPETKGRLYSIDVVNRTTAFAVGLGGLILRTTDRGFKWKKLKAPAPSWLAAVEFVSPTTGYIVGGAKDGPVLWKTVDGGGSWVSLADKLPPSARKKTQSFRDVVFTSDVRGIVVGTGGVIVETNDGGKTWTARDSGTDAWLRAIHVRGKTIHVAGKGVLLRSDDGGRAWKKLPIPDGLKLNDVAFSTKQIGWITEFGGAVLETRDAGQTWNAVHQHKRGTIGIEMSDERIIVTTEDGTVLRRRG